ncbi:MAG TPA: DUF4062 domain-containing protein [Mucilaginibacter sp.]|nr:DUF4062 domain-containing protein [Mucilaginibacter sp.]
MIERKFQVFVSSTYKDLIEERSEIIQALLELDCIPIGMELFPAGDEDQWTSIKKIIDNCDYYVLIIAGRYGSESEEGISYTQLEYEYAISKQIPTIAFIHKTPTELPANKVDTLPEKIEKLANFRLEVQNKMCRFWDNKDKLRSQISTSMVRLLKDKPRNGWIRAQDDFSEDFLKVGKYISYFTPRRNEFNSLFDTTIINAANTDNIDIIGISQRLTFTDYPGVDVFVDKITNGCNFRILLLHPDSLLTKTIENLSKDYGFSDLRRNIISVINGVISELYLRLSKKVNEIEGSLEIRLHRNVFSSLSYHSVNDRVLLGLYYSHISGTHCPTFELKDEKTKSDAKKHFETLWNKSAENVLIKVNSALASNRLDIFREEKFDFNYFENGILKQLSNYEPYQWIPSKFHNKAARVIEIAQVKPKDLILDYGCAKGFLVRAFRELNYLAWGCDISNYAIENCDSKVKSDCFLIKGTTLIPNELNNLKFHTISFIHVLEHIEVKEITRILSTIITLAGGIYVEVPLGNGINYNNTRHENDKTHLHKNAMEWWIEIFERNGFKAKYKNIVNNDYGEIYCETIQ